MKRAAVMGLGAIVAVASGVLVGCTSNDSAAGSHVIWVAPNGRDAGPGTERAPFRTLTRARDAVRQRHRDGATVNLRTGTYRITRPIMLDGRDSGRVGHEVVYRSAPGEHATISGARSVPGTAWSRVAGSANIWQAQVGHVPSRQLIVNGRRAQIAQTPDFPVGFLPHWSTTASESGIQFRVTDLNPPTWGNPSTWTNPGAIEAVVDDQWRMMSVPLRSIVPPTSPGGTGLLTMAEPAWNNANVFRAPKTNAPGIWSFWQVTRFRNAMQFLDEPGEWYLDSPRGRLFYIPRSGEDLTTALVELPQSDGLIKARGSATAPVTDLRFEGITFTGATWMDPSSGDGYVADQAGFRLVGANHRPNVIGHDEHAVPTPGSLQFDHARRVTVRGNIFEHLGAVGLEFGSGAQHNRIEGNLFRDIASAGIQLGDVSARDAHPESAAEFTSGNTISGNLLQHLGRDYHDAAGITAGFTQQTTISNNTIVDVPWTGISMGWGWGLLDPGSFLGLSGATNGMWGNASTPTQNRDNVIRANRVDGFLNTLWDGGAIYTTGAQGTSMANGLRIEANVATHKRPDGGGNIFYTDGGSRYVVVERNVSIDNPIGVVDFGPAPPADDPLAYSGLLSLADGQHYGAEIGGCRTYGDIRFTGNQWLQPPLPTQIDQYRATYESWLHFTPYSPENFFDVCPYSKSGVSYPTRLTFHDNQVLTDPNAVRSIIDRAGVQQRPTTIPLTEWDPPQPSA